MLKPSNLITHTICHRYFHKYFDRSCLSKAEVFHPLLVPIDYYILENNSQLKAALKFKRILLTDFPTLQMEHFGEHQV